MARTEGWSGASRLVTAAAVIVVVAALYFAKTVLIPLTLAILVSFLLTPLVVFLERLRFGRTAAVLTVVTLAFGIFAVLGYVVAAQLTDLAAELPRYKDNILHKVHSLKGNGDSAFTRAAETIQEIGENLQGGTTRPATTQAAAATPASPAASLTPVEPPATQPAQPLPVQIVEPPASALSVLRTTLLPLVEPLGTAGIVLIFVIFMLIQREDLRDRLIRLVGRQQLTLTTQAFDDAARRISRYLLMQLIVNVTYGVPVAVGLWFIGLPNAVLWGLLATVLRYIPYLGPWIAASMPIALSIAIEPGWIKPLETIALFVILELISNNVIEPWLYGSSTGISAMAVLVAAVFWTWIWGGVGLLLSVPLTVCLVVLGKYVPQLAFLNVLLGDEPAMSPPMRVYQRLLAWDQEEAMDQVEEELKTQPLAEVYDRVLIPALGMAEQDRHRGELDEERQNFVRRALKEMIEELGEAQKEADATANKANGKPDTADAPRDKCAVVACLPARDEADEIVAMMLAQILGRAGIDARPISVTSLASEMIDAVAACDAAVACISALPPSAAVHARYLCKRMAGRVASVELVVGLWTYKGDLTRAKNRVACGRGVTLVTSLADALNQIQQLVQPRLAQNKAK